MQETPELEEIVDLFVKRVAALVAARAQEQARAVVLGALGGGEAEGLIRRGPGRPPASRKITLTAKASKARKLQGKYLGSLRRLKGADRGRVKRMAKEKGVAEAVRLAATLGR
jgi:hypothetical protein